MLAVFLYLTIFVTRFQSHKISGQLCCGFAILPYYSCNGSSGERGCAQFNLRQTRLFFFFCGCACVRVCVCACTSGNFWPDDGTKGRIRGSPKSTGVLFRKPRTSAVLNLNKKKRFWETHLFVFLPRVKMTVNVKATASSRLA